jgi:hypothetical protein
MKVIVNDAFLYDLHRLNERSRELWMALRDLRVVASSANERWKNIVNKEPQMEREINLYKDKAETALRECNVALFTITGKTLDIDINELIKGWKG